MTQISQAPWVSKSAFFLASIAIWETAKGMVVDWTFHHLATSLAPLGADTLAKATLLLAFVLLGSLLLSAWLYFESRTSKNAAIRFKAELLRLDPDYFEHKEYQEAFYKLP